MKLLALMITVLTFNAYALEVKQNPDNLNMAVSITDNIIELQLEAPMDLLLGFTKKPESKEELAQWSKVQALWFAKQKELIHLKGLSCLEVESSIEYEIEEDLAYGEDLAKGVLKCNKTVEATELTLKLKEKFSKVKNIDVTLFPNSGESKTLVLTKNIEKITL